MSEENPSILWSVDQSLNSTAKATAQNNMGVGSTMITGAPSDKYVSWTHRDTNGNIHVNQESIQSTFVPDSGLADSHRPINALGVLDAMRNTFAFSQDVSIDVNNDRYQVGDDVIIASPNRHQIKVKWNRSQDGSADSIIVSVSDEEPSANLDPNEIFSIVTVMRFGVFYEYQNVLIPSYNNVTYDTRANPTPSGQTRPDIQIPIDHQSFGRVNHERYEITITFGNSQDSLWIRVIPVKYVENTPPTPHRYRLVISGQFMPGPAPSNNSPQA